MSQTTPEEIVQVHSGFVRALAVRLAPWPGLAEDIAQQVFLEFLVKADQWDLQRDVRPLLAGMTRNVALRTWRERTRSMPDQLADLAEHIRGLAESQEVDWPAQEGLQALQDCVAKLPDKSRRLIELHYYLEVTSVEISRQMAVKADAVRRALFRLRDQLRRCIQDVLKDQA